MISVLYKVRVWCFLFVLVAATSSCKKDNILVKKPMPEVTLNSSRFSDNDMHLVKDTVYIISENLTRNANQSLTVDAGTLVKVRSNIGITINPGGKLIANGTQAAPIIFTADAYEGTPGRSPSNTGQLAWTGITFNTTTAAAPSSLQYVRIEFAGTASGFAALSLRNVDKSTRLNHIQVSYAVAMPSFEFNGGNCTAEYLVSYASANNDFTINNGYTGMLQHLLAYRHPYFITTSGSVLAGLSIQNAGTFPAISNITVIGPDNQNGTSIRYSDTVNSFSGRRVAALVVGNMAKFHIRNSIFAGFPRGGFYIDSKESGVSLQVGESDFMYSFVHSNDSNRVYFIPTNLIPSNPPITAKDFKAFMAQPQFNDQVFLATGNFAFTDSYNYDVNPNPLPAANSPVVSGANFDGLVFSDPFFKKVNHRGAFGADSWLQGWTNFLPLQTNYNN